MEGEKKPGFLTRLTEKIIGSKQPEQEKIETAEEIIDKSKIKDSLCGPDGCKLIIESMQGNVEPHYFWILRFLRETTGYGLQLKRIEKIKDLYAAAEASSLWGSQEQRKGLQQDKVSQYMATIGKMIKDTFQIIRELRIIDERLIFYDEYNAYSKGDSDKASGAVTLKGTWVDLVEGGTKNPASVYGLASQVGFVTLPDLFFTVHPKSINDVDKEVNKLKSHGINRKVREVLGRKLKQFIIWKEKTENELKTRKNFVLKYLRMHVNNIKLYISWVKPYLKAIKKLQMVATENRPDIATAFETSQIELELLAIGSKYTRLTKDLYEVDYEFKKYLPCIRVQFNNVVLPQMAFQREFQRGPIHAGRTEITITPYVLANEDIEKYKAAKDKEVLEEIEDLVPSLEGALSSLGEELTNYLKEAGELKEEKKEIPKEKEGLLSPFFSIFKGIKEIFSKEGSPNEQQKPLPGEEEEAKSQARQASFLLYDAFKKAHGMLSV